MPSKHEPTISVRVTEAQLEALKVLAEADDRSISQIVRFAIEAWIKANLKEAPVPRAVS
jgi:predicted transcriptional regulator